MYLSDLDVEMFSVKGHSSLNLPEARPFLSLFSFPSTPAGRGSTNSAMGAALCRIRVIFHSRISRMPRLIKDEE